MSQVNRVLDLISDEEAASIHAATDITGFGLAGHSMQMAKASNTTFNFEYKSLPVFKNAIAAISEGFLTKAHRTNREYTSPSCNFEALADFEAQILFDPQTSGGLLLSVSPDASSSILSKLRSRFNHAQIIGEVTNKTVHDWSIC
jgi:selenide,water dikinase